MKKKKEGVSPEIIQKIERITNNPTEEDIGPLKKMLEELRRGLPPASDEVLNSCCTW